MALVIHIAHDNPASPGLNRSPWDGGAANNTKRLYVSFWRIANIEDSLVDGVATTLGPKDLQRRLYSQRLW